MLSYYGELCTKMYESDKSFAEGKELEFYLSFANTNDMTVLEPMCGNGRMLIPFMQRDINIEGFDISESMLNVCIEKGNKLNLKPNVYLDKLENFVSINKFDLIMIPFGSFSLLPSELVYKSLTNLRNVLKINGKLLLTIMLKSNHIYEISEWSESNKKFMNNEWIIEYKKIHYDEEHSTLVTNLKYVLVKDNKNEKIERMDFAVRLYKVEEFTNILKAIGFQTIHLHEVKNGYGEGSSFHVFECSI